MAYGGVISAKLQFSSRLHIPPSRSLVLRPMGKFQSYLQLAVAFAVAILRTRKLRRTFMFWLSIVTMLLVFLGLVVWNQSLEEIPALFIGYWMVCFGLVLMMLLFAVFDMLATYSELRGEANLEAPSSEDLPEKENDSETGESSDSE